MSATESKYFTGVSDRGDFNEALHNAIAFAKEQLFTNLVSWKLVEIAGRDGGFVGEKHLVVRIDAAAGAAVGSLGESSGAVKDKITQVPVFISGPIYKSDGVDFCQDGADFRLNTFVKEYRLKAGSEKVQEILEKAADEGRALAIAGYKRFDSECQYILVYYAGSLVDTLSLLGGEFPRGL